MNIRTARIVIRVVFRDNLQFRQRCFATAAVVRASRSLTHAFQRV
jgi:hypothetical protein